VKEKNEILNLQRMGPLTFKETVPRSHSLKIKNGKKELWQPLMAKHICYGFLTIILESIHNIEGDIYVPFVSGIGKKLAWCNKFL
jgi:hypothetical protein